MRVWLVLALSLALRVALPPAHTTLAERVELATPLTSWPGLSEGIARLHLGLDPYEGRSLHQPPLLLLPLASLLGTGVPDSVVAVFFIAADVALAVALRALATEHVHSRWAASVADYEAPCKAGLAPDGSRKVLAAVWFRWAPEAVFAISLLHPYAILACVARSTAVLGHLASACALLAAYKARAGTACLSLAVATYLAVYPVLLLVPVALLLRSTAGTMLRTSAGVFTVLLSGLAALSYLAFDSWAWAESCYGTLLLVTDLTPNVGLWWYFFTELFEHFSTFFRIVFHAHVAVYLVPFTMAYRSAPLFLATLLLSITTVFKSYPSVGDSAFMVSFLPLFWPHLLPYARYTFVAVGCILATTLLGPIAWYLWIDAGSGNANFFFAMTLVYALGHVWLLVDLAHCFEKHRALRKHVEAGFESRLLASLASAAKRSKQD